MNQNKRWCVTITNSADEDAALLRDKLTRTKCVYAVFGRDTGPQTGTPHLQGFVHLRKQTRLAGMKKLVGDRAHLEQARGSDVQNRDYSTARRAARWSWRWASPKPSPPPTKPFKTAMRMVKRLAEEGADLSEILDDEEYAAAYNKHQRYMETATDLKKSRKSRKATHATTK